MDTSYTGIFSRKSVRNVGILFAVSIALLTFFSSTINNLLVPVVDIYTPSAGVIKKTMEFSGEIKASSTKKIIINTKSIVNEIKIKPGTRIEVGSVIASIDMDDAGLEITKKELEIKKLENELIKIQNRINAPDLSSYKNEVSMAEYELKIQSMNLVSVKVQQNDIPYKTLLEAESKAKAAQISLETKQKLLEQKTLETQLLIEEQKINIDILKAELGIKRKEYEEFSDIIRLGGIIVSPFKGTVRTVSIKEAIPLMPGQCIAEIIPDNATYNVLWRLDEMKAAVIGQGSKIAIETGINYMKTLKSNVTEITYLSAENLYEYSAEMVVSDQTVFEGQNVKIKFEQEPKRYQTVVPTNAIITVGREMYCIFVLRDRKSVLGNEKYAERIDITIEDSDGSSSAIKTNAPFGGNDRVIMYSSKPLEDNMQVRLR